MKTYCIAEKSDADGAVYFKALGFLDGKCYRGRNDAAYPRTNALRIMTRNPNAWHPGDWNDPACHVQVCKGLMPLCEYELKVLRVCSGENVPDMPWGAAMGQALESLEGARLVQRKQGVYSATISGRAELERLKLAL